MSKLLVLLAWLLQTFIVFAGNSRFFGLVGPGSGWYTNVEMSFRYPSLVTPAKWAFAIWGIIYTWEIVMVCYLAIRPTTGLFWQGANPALWIAANAFQGLWALCFANERLALASVALAGIAASLTCLATSMRAASALEYFLVAAPIWLHAGWTTAAAIVNANLLVTLGAQPAAQLAAAHASAFLACAVGLAVCLVNTGKDSSSPLVPTPLVGALCWALLAIRAELVAPGLGFNPINKEQWDGPSRSTYAEIGEIGRAALILVFGSCALLLAGGGVAIAIARYVSAQGWVELK